MRGGGGRLAGGEGGREGGKTAGKSGRDSGLPRRCSCWERNDGGCSRRCYTAAGRDGVSDTWAPLGIIYRPSS